MADELSEADRVYWLLTRAGFVVELGNDAALAIHPDSPGLLYEGHGSTDEACMRDLARACRVNVHDVLNADQGTPQAGNWH